MANPQSSQILVTSDFVFLNLKVISVFLNEVYRPDTPAVATLRGWDHIFHTGVSLTSSRWIAHAEKRIKS